MHPPTRRPPRPPLLHHPPELPPTEPISAAPLAYPPETPVPYLAANISSGSTSPHLVMARNKRSSPPTAKPHRLSTAPGNYAYVSPHTLVSTLRPSGFACRHAALRAACQHFSFSRSGLAWLRTRNNRRRRSGSVLVARLSNNLLKC